MSMPGGFRKGAAFFQLYHRTVASETRLLLSNILLLFFLDISRAREYCESEAFRARCRSNEVILMQSALYGRMRLGKWTLNQDHYR